MLTTVKLPRLDKVTPILWAWDGRAKRYRDRATGQFLKPAALQRLQRQNITLIEGDLQTIGQLLIDNKLSLKGFQESFAQTLKQLHLQQMVLARGGTQSTTATDYLAVGRTLRQEYQYLQGLATDINRGYSVGTNGQNIPLTVARFKNRIRLYAQKARLSYEQGMLANHLEQGMGYEWRLLSPEAQHCPSCLRYAALSIQPIGTLPRPTEACECGGECKCAIRFAQTLEQAIALRA